LAYPAQSIRSAKARLLPALAGDFQDVVSASGADYLGAHASYRNAAAGAKREPKLMTTFDKREEAFEKRFAMDEELKFKTEARRNKLLGLWAAALLGQSGEAASAYAREVIAAGLEGTGGAMRKVSGDLEAGGVAVPATELNAKFDELTALAIAQLKAGK
jgi:hypothetical protein